MSKPKPYTMQVTDAVLASSLPADLKFLLMVMAYEANSATGRGLSGQKRLASLVGCTDRAVRLKLERLAAMPESPVQLVRHYRQRRDGRGRTSDEYQLVLTNRKPASAETPASTGSPLPDEAERPTGSRDPVEQAYSNDDQPEVQGGPTGSAAYDQPEAGFQGSSERSMENDPRRSLVAAKRATGSSAGSSKKGKKAIRTPKQQEAFVQVRNRYFEQFEARRGEKPIFGKPEGAAVYTLLDKLRFNVPIAERVIDTAFQSFRGGSVTILNIAANPQGFEAQLVKVRNGTAAPQPGDDFDFSKFEASNA